MKKLLKKSSFIFLAAMLTLGLGVAGLFGAAPENNIDAAVTPDANPQVVVVSGTNRQGSPLSFGSTTAQFDGVNYSTATWRELKSFNISFQKASEYEAEGPYSWKIGVQFMQVDPAQAGTWNPDATDVIAQGEEESDTANIKTEYLVDKTGPIDAEATHDFHGWGLYRFLIDIKGEDGENKHFGSQFYYVQPDSITTNPEIVATEIVGKSGWRNTYEVTVTNLDYVNENLFVWYVVGKGDDNKNYCLYEGDTEKMPELYTAADTWQALNSAEADKTRTGRTFTFEANQYGTDGTISGSWQIYCVVYDKPFAEGSTATQYKGSLAEPVKTGKIISQSMIIWLIVGGAVLLLGLIIFIIVRSVKKEKVW